MSSGTNSGDWFADTTLRDNISVGALYYNGPVSAAEFDGIIDEVQVFNAVLSEAQIKLLYNQGKAAVFGATSTDSSGVGTWSALNEYCPPGQGSSCTAPIGEWLFNEKNGTNTYDTSENNNTGTFTSSPVWNHAGECHSGSCLYFDGSNDKVSHDNTDVGALTAITVSLWLKTSRAAQSKYQGLVSKGTPNGYEDFVLGMGNTGSNPNKMNLYFVTDLGNSGNQATTSDMNDGEWHHVAWTWDSSDGGWKIYADGVVENEGTRTGSNIIDSDNEIRFGAYKSTYGDYFEGLIDEIRIYNYERTPEQVAWEYNRGGPVAHWKFDECSGDTVYDSSGNGNDGTIYPQTGNAVGTCSGTSGDMWADGTNGKRNAALAFDGTDDYVETTDIYVNNFTITAWAWADPSISGSYVGVVNKWDTGGGDAADDWGMYYHSGNYAYWLYTDAGTLSDDTSTTFPTGQWTFMAMTYDGEYYRGYADGLQVGQDIQGSPPQDTNDGTWNITIGSNRTETTGVPTYFFEGLIDDVRIYNYVMTQQQMDILMNDGAANFE
jgi:hypothetical protein